MNKITLKALQLAGFQNADMIAEILNYVPNSTAALEMLLGVHVPMEINTYFKRGNDLIKVNVVNELGDSINFTEYEQKTTRVWYLTAEDQQNGVYTTTDPGHRNYHDYKFIPCAGVNQRDRKYTIQEFNSYYKEISEEEFYTTIDKWETFGMEAKLNELAL